MSSQRRIAIVVSTFPPYRGGMGSVAEQEARLLAESGEDVTVFTVTGKDERRAQSGERSYKIIELPALFRFGNAAFVPALWRAIEGFDTVHLHYPFFGGAEVLLFKKLFQPSFRYVLTYHMDVVGFGWLKTLFAIHARTFLPMILKRADRILVSSRDYAETSPLLRPFWSKIDAKIVEIPFPAPKVSPLHPTPYTLNPRFLFLGGLDRAHYFKGVPVLLEAFKLALPKLPEAKLSIIGSGNSRPGLEMQARELGISDRVTFHGSVPPGPEFDRLVGSARALVLPSLDRSEAFGMVLLEALARGVPVIASDLPGVRTVATDEVGLRVSPGDVAALAAALVELGTNDELSAKFSANAKRIVAERYTEDRYLEALKKVL